MASRINRLTPLTYLSLSLLLVSTPSWAGELLSVESLTSPTHVSIDSPSVEAGTSAIKTSLPSLANQDFSKEDAQRQLQQLVQAQQAMMQQIETLKVRIEKNEAQSNENTGQLSAMSEESKAQAGALESLTKRTRLGGYVEAGWRTFGNAPRTGEFLGANGESRNSFDLRRAVLRPIVQFTDKAGWIGEVEFEDAGLDGIAIEQSEFYYTHKPWLNLRAGLMVPQMTVTSWLHEGTNRLLVDRPLVDQFVVPSTYRDLGVGISGVIPLLEESAMNYELMVLHGFTDLIDADAPAGTPVSNSLSFNGLRRLRPSSGSNSDHFLDNNNNKALFSRIGFLPWPNMEVGVGAHIGAIDEGNSKTLSILTSDVRYRYKRLSLLGEYANALFERGDGFNSQGITFSLFPSSVNGYFLQAGLDLTDKLTAVTGWNSVDLDESVNGNSLWRFSAGLRYNPVGRVFLKAEYQLTSARDHFPEEHLSNALLTQLTFDF